MPTVVSARATDYYRDTTRAVPTVRWVGCGRSCRGDCREQLLRRVDRGGPAARRRLGRRGRGGHDGLPTSPIPTAHDVDVSFTTAAGGLRGYGAAVRDVTADGSLRWNAPCTSWHREPTAENGLGYAADGCRRCTSASTSAASLSSSWSRRVEDRAHALGRRVDHYAVPLLDDHLGDALPSRTEAFCELLFWCGEDKIPYGSECPIPQFGPSRRSGTSSCRKDLVEGTGTRS